MLRKGFLGQTDRKKPEKGTKIALAIRIIDDREELDPTGIVPRVSPGAKFLGSPGHYFWAAPIVRGWARIRLNVKKPFAKRTSG
ncbi:MAG: hypothetical protein C5B50_02480 [Verrucomicrobia bacterium]|nr:MAG: hypothetical protein C5B50_02480 [Verrucomicrobiota bacterium]